MKRPRRQPRVLTWEELNRPAELNITDFLAGARWLRTLPAIVGGIHPVEIETVMGIACWMAEHPYHLDVARRFPLGTRTFGSLEELYGAAKAAAHG